MSKENKVVLKDRDVGEKGCSLLKSLYFEHSVHGYTATNTRMLSEKTGIRLSVIRKVMSRLALFGLIHEEGEAARPKSYSINKDGIAFVKRLLEKEKDVLSVASAQPMIPPSESPKSDRNSKPQPDSLVKWLREKADELNAMADHLSNYE